MTLELRVLNGLHRGASLPLEHGIELVLGSDPGCDVVLVDQGMPAFALRLGVQPDAWLAYPTDAQGQDLHTQPMRLALGLAFELHGIRVCVCESDQVWAFDLAPATQPIGADAPQLQADTPFAADMGSAAIEHDTAAQAELETSTPDAVPPPALPTRRRASRGIGRRHRAWLVLPMTALLGMVAFRAASMAARDPEPALGQAAELAAASASRAAASAASAPATQEELRRLFKARLQAAELLKVLEVDLGETRWTLRGDLGPEEDARLERLVAAFFAQHRPNVSFEATIVPSEELLPFRITHISAGRLAHVVTHEGQRLFVGDSCMGYTLARVEANKVVFTGKRRIEVAL